MTFGVGNQPLGVGNKIFFGVGNKMVFGVGNQPSGVGNKMVFGVGNQPPGVAKKKCGVGNGGRLKNKKHE